MAATAMIEIPEPMPVKPPPVDFKDPCSFSNPGQILTQHIHIDLHIDFPKRLLTGIATLDFRIFDQDAKEVILDARGLNISCVESVPTRQNTDDGMSATPIPYRWLDSTAAACGDAVAITVPSCADGLFAVRIAYTTDGLGAPPAGGACDWLSPAQAGGRPFVFTQAQAIHARSLFPCQDTPAAKAPYSAVVSLDDSARDLQVVMSAQSVRSETGDRKGSSRFVCCVPIPPYLFAFAVGKLGFRDVSTRCRVWALPDVVERAAWEFADVERFLQVAEKLAGPYVWGRYDLLVLPSSFPYGGMENPMLTFVTPTLLAGDRSLVSVVIHEIAHSWAGNLVSCQDCRHFWINEGFTVKLERRILRELYGSGLEGVDAIAGRQSLDSFVESVGADHKYTQLVVPIQDGEDPDDYFSRVPYEKGYNLLLLLEEMVKRDYGADFHDFLKTYFERFQYQAIHSQHFVDMFRETFPDSAEKVDLNRWIYAPGGCPELAKVDTSLVKAAGQVAEDWVMLFGSADTTSEETLSSAVREKFGEHAQGEFKKWDAKQQLCLLTSLSALLLTEGDSAIEGSGVVWNASCARLMQHVYDFDQLRNSEMRFLWYRLALKAGYSDIVEHVTRFLREQGRMKFVRPLFHDLHSVFPKGMLAANLFAEIKESYHSIASKMIERDLARSN